MRVLFDHHIPVHSFKVVKRLSGTYLKIYVRERNLDGTISKPIQALDILLQSKGEIKKLITQLKNPKIIEPSNAVFGDVSAKKKKAILKKLQRKS